MSAEFRKLIEGLVDTGQLYELADEAFSASDIIRKLGYSVSGNRTVLLKEIIVDNDIDTSHWRVNGTKPSKQVTLNCPVCTKLFSFPEREPKTTCGYSCANTYFRSGKDHPNWKNGSLSTYRANALREYGCICSKCGYSENLAAIVVHHIDKNRENNSIDNLQVLCCNCHAILHHSMES